MAYLLFTFVDKLITNEILVLHYFRNFVLMFAERETNNGEKGDNEYFCEIAR